MTRIRLTLKDPLFYGMGFGVSLRSFQLGFPAVAFGPFFFLGLYQGSIGDVFCRGLNNN